MAELGAKPVRIFVVWEPVLFTDWASPSTTTLGRISSNRAAQFWDKDRLISHSMGEHDRSSIVWDHIVVYPAGATWEDRPPQPLYEDGPVVRVLDETRAALNQALKPDQAHHRARNEISMDVRKAIQNGDAHALRQLLSEDSSRADEVIEWGDQKNA